MEYFDFLSFFGVSSSLIQLISSHFSPREEVSETVQEGDRTAREEDASENSRKAAMSRTANRRRPTAKEMTPTTMRAKERKNQEMKLTKHLETAAKTTMRR